MKVTLQIQTWEKTNEIPSFQEFLAPTCNIRKQKEATVVNHYMVEFRKKNLDPWRIQSSSWHNLLSLKD